MATRTQTGAIGAATERSRLFWIPVTALITSLIPLQFEIAGLLLSPLRIFLIGIVPYLIVRALSGAAGRPVFSDYAIVFFCGWMALSILVHHSVGRMLTFAGSNVLLILGGYLIGRVVIRSASDFLSLVKALFIAVLCLLPLAIWETFLLKPALIIGWVNQFDWVRGYVGSEVQIRFGLNRAQVVMTHAIHFGIFCSLSFSVFFLGMTNRLSLGKRCLGGFLIAFATACSLSSGPLGSIIFQSALIGYAILFHSVPAQWKIAQRGGLLLYVILELNTTKAAFFALAEKISYSSHNAYTRQIMISTATDLMARYPLFGWGLRSWPLPYWMRYSSSIDNYWAVLGGGFGIPTILSVLAAFIWPMIRAGGNRLRKGSDLYWVRVSWTIQMMGMIIVLATVHLWGPLTTIVYMMLGAGMFLMNATEPDETNAVAAVQPSRPRGPVYTRFPQGNVTTRGGRA